MVVTSPANKRRRARCVVGATFIALLASGCASSPGSSRDAGGVSSRGADGVTPSVTEGDVSSLRTGAGWEFDAGPVPPPTSIISAEDAEKAAENVVRGDVLRASANRIAALVYVTNIVGPKGSVPAVNQRLAWVIQVTDVLIPHSVPTGGGSPVITNSTVQWVIDASTGQYVEARDF